MTKTPRFLKPVRLKYKDIQLLRMMLKFHVARLRQQGLPHDARQAKYVMRSLPISSPYTVELYPRDWEHVSKALRPNGDKPKAGSIYMSAMVLYQKLSDRGLARQAKYGDDCEPEDRRPLL